MPQRIRVGVTREASGAGAVEPAAGGTPEPGGNLWSKLRDSPRLAAEAGYRAGLFARRLGLSVRQLERRFAEEMGYSPHVWLDVLRMQEAVRRLIAGEQVKTVAAGSGFAHTSNFIRCFERAHRVTPGKLAARVDPRFRRSKRARPLSLRRTFPPLGCPYFGSSICRGWCSARLGWRVVTKLPSV